jgi:uncharacterized protein with ATP-grasp and redox domains
MSQKTELFVTTAHRTSNHTNLNDISDEHEECLQEEISMLEKRYQDKRSSSMTTHYCHTSVMIVPGVKDNHKTSGEFSMQFLP